MIGVGPHDMGGGEWLFVAALQGGLVVLAAVSLWVALRATRRSR